MKTKGLTFKKFDLHIHTPGSKCYSGKETPEQIVNKCDQAELSAIAVTDHNTGAWVDDIKKAAQKVDLTVFPGVEITVGDAHNHIIALFDINKTTRDIEALLTKLDIDHEQFGKTDAFSSKTVIQAIDIITGEPFNGLAVLAHIDSTNGVFKQMGGEPRVEVIRNPKLLAVEAVDYLGVYKFLNGTDPNYRRRLAIYQASDNPYLDAKGKPEKEGTHSGKHGINGIGFRYSYFKVDENITLESLRQCFIDPAVRIRQTFEYKERQSPYIKNVTINSGFLAGVDFPLHQGLNSILGAKGTGKSLLIEFIRFALDQEPLHRDILKDHNDKLEEQLGQYGVVEVDIGDETGKEYKIKRTYNPSEDNPLESTDITLGKNINANIAQLFPILFLSQGEIIKIAEEEELQMDFIDKFFNFHKYRNKINGIETEMELLDNKFTESLKACHEVKRLTTQHETATIELKRLTEHLKNPIYKEIEQYEIKDKILRNHRSYLLKLNEHIEGYETLLNDEETPIIPKELETDPQILRTRDHITEARNQLLDSIKSERRNIELIFNKVASEYKIFKTVYDAKLNIYQAEVVKTGGDVQRLELQRKFKTKEIEDIEKKLNSARSKAKNIKDISDNRNKKLTELKSVYGEYYQDRKTKCEYFEKLSNGKLQIVINESTNKDEFLESLSMLKKGSYLREPDIEQLCEKITPDEFILNLLRYDIARLDDTKDSSRFLKEIALKTDLLEEKIKKISDHLLGTKTYEEMLLLQYKAFPQDRPEIKYNIGDEGKDQYVLIKNISIGQKCTAMLILSLSEGMMPIIIDQPEDSLDLRAIWEDMCIKLRSGKEQRQFIFTTHNSSVAVASDSDKFIIMAATANKGEVVLSGAIDNEDVRKEVIKYLEGGMPTYQLKYNKYGIPLKTLD